ncbi:MAG: glycosyltransferase, partial [Bacteroidaceae bacterium]|nr:glycosyltransferase [Bacteroidaceae bacterium]
DMLSIYASADCVVSCSRYETLPTTLVEAQAVGTTPVAYRHSGALDLITDGVTGYLAEYRDTRSLANAIERAIDHPLPPAALHDHVVQTYNGDRIAQKHLEIYKLP